MESIEVRRAWLKAGGSLTAAARELGTSKQIVDYHVRKANRDAPLTYQQGDQADRDAMSAYARACLKRAGIRIGA